MGDVVDENVLVVANGRGTHAGFECMQSCVEFLETCSENGDLVLDAERVLLERYASKCDWSGQPGVGDQFFVWAFDHQHELENVSLRVDPDGRPEAVPTVLEAFDLDDQIYLALALEAAPPSRIVNAVDSDYREANEELDSVGIVVLELCPHELKP